ncbi:MAG TPA: DUF2309 domain-containing protein [Rhodocyclaceae bacterium]|nr:DUF2309 domain-containing protein [Rhodocyclaceae bacterium]
MSATDLPGDDWLSQVLHRLDHLLPAQAPIRDFVHHNTLHGFQHLPFRQAIAAARQTHGHAGYLPVAEFRRLHQNGRIDDADLLAAIDSVVAEAPDDFPFCRQPLPAGIDRVGFWLALLKAPTEPLTRAALRWKIEEEQAPATDDALWLVCCRSVQEAAGDGEGSPDAEALRSSHGDSLRSSDGDSLRSSHGDSLRSQKNPDNAAAPDGDEAAALFDSIGVTRTWSEVLQLLTGIDLRTETTPRAVRILAAGLDQGVAAWPLPQRSRGLYAAWRDGLRSDPTQGGASNDLGRTALYAELPDDPAAAITLLLDHYALPEPRRAAYLTRLALQLPGWTGMLNWLAQHPAAQRETPLRLLDGLAILLASEYHAVSRLIFDRWSLRPRIDMLAWYFREHPAEALIRYRLHATPLPEVLAARAARLIASVPNPAEGDDPEWQALAAEIRRADRDHARLDRDAGLAYPLWQVCRSAGIDAATLHADTERRLVAALIQCDEERRGYVWLLAYERHYRQQVLAVLARQAELRALECSSPPRPSAQVLCCMDEREEGLRRHLEEVAPEVETLGAAGFFGVAMRWQGLDAESEVALCPVVVTPRHRVSEVARDETTGQRRETRRQRRLGLRRRLFQHSRHELLSALLATVAGAPLALAALAGRLFAPRLTGDGTVALQRRFDGVVDSELRFTATSPDPDAGFTDDEQVDRVAGILRTIGLVNRFAPLVVILGHGSHSLNNPHASAYDCGACGGKHGGPNARLLAAMANRPEVRQQLALRGIVIPDDSVFLGAQHDTCDDRVSWFDSDKLPASHREAFVTLRQQLDEACRRHAHERCRRFASAPDGLSPDAAQRHVAARGEMPAQARPELGHVTNACAIIGRRALSSGSFLDRRCFLISYDPQIDADGTILENILLAAGPVGAGISLEYYFSTVNNAGYGCRSKVMHNLAGLIGVMEGTQSDLRTGLPQQMIEIHEAMRLLVVCDAETATLDAVVGRQPALTELVGHGWITVVSLSPSSGALALFEPARGWLPWSADNAPQVPVVEQSIDCFVDETGRYRRDALTPALLRPRELR